MEMVKYLVVTVAKLSSQMQKNISYKFSSLRALRMGCKRKYIAGEE
jgi:hypothetical protein